MKTKEELTVIVSPRPCPNNCPMPLTPTCIPVKQKFRGREITVEANIFQCERCRFIALGDDFLEELASKMMALATT